MENTLETYRLAESRFIDLIAQLRKTFFYRVWGLHITHVTPPQEVSDP